MVVWKTIFIIVAALFLIVIILLFVFGLLGGFKPKLDPLLQILDYAIRSIFDISEWFH